MSVSFTQQIHDVIEEGIKRNGTAYALAKVSGVSKSNISRWLDGMNPRTKDVAKLMDFLGVKILLPGEQLATYEFIPCGMARLDADGNLKLHELPHAPVALERSWLKYKDINAARSIMVEAPDDSMAPLFSINDLVLVDQTDIEPRQGRIYLLSDQKGELKIRRLKSNVGTAWTLLCDNPIWSWAHETIPDISHIRIHGRVRWTSRIFD